MVFLIHTYHSKWCLENNKQIKFRLGLRSRWDLSIAQLVTTLKPLNLWMLFQVQVTDQKPCHNISNITMCVKEYFEIIFQKLEGAHNCKGDVEKLIYSQWSHWIKVWLWAYTSTTPRNTYTVQFSTNHIFWVACSFGIEHFCSWLFQDSSLNHSMTHKIKK